MSLQRYQECQCIASSNNNSHSSMLGGAVSGRCVTDCPLRAPFFLLLFLMITFTFLATVPMITSTLRYNSSLTGGGWNPPPPPSTFRGDNFAEFFSRAPALSRLFSFESCATFDAIFVKIGRTVPKLRNIM